jgi:hypothetical protein
MGMLRYVVTDAWVPPSSFLANVSGCRLTDRFHDELSHARVMAFNSSLILFEFFDLNSQPSTRDRFF